MQNSLKKKALNQGKNHDGKHITNILTENACNIKIFNTKKEH